LALAPFLLLVLVVALLAPMLLSGWLFSAQALQPDFGRLNPVSGIGRLFSAVSLGELGKAVGKAMLVGGVAGWALWSRRDELLGLSVEPLAAGVAHMGEVLAVIFLLVSASLVLIAGIDVPLQIWQHHKQLRMTREEVRQEAKESEGDPQVKARIRSMQREAARKRMMAEVPKAQVIVTNPTQYAVALRYEANMRAPRVVAKGTHLLAERIREAGVEHGVPILQAPPLARALYRHAGLGEEIPTALFDAVAEVLAWVYQLKRREAGAAAPAPPRDLPVPAELDPEAT
jgi:flagellar biosynthetic protein FlhB